MKYRKISVHMTEKEIQDILKMIFPKARLKNYERYEKQNFIIVYYELPDDEQNEEYRVDFLPDDIYVLSDDNSLDGEPIKDGEIAWKYMQFTVSRGYSDLWKDNNFNRKTGGKEMKITDAEVTKAIQTIKDYCEERQECDECNIDCSEFKKGQSPCFWIVPPIQSNR